MWGGNTLGVASRIKIKLSRSGFIQDTVRGYPVYRAWNPVGKIGPIAATFKPDVAVVQHQDTVPFAATLIAAGVPVVVYLRNLEYEELGGSLADLPKSVRYIANSRFTATAYRDRYAIDPVVLPPLVDPDRYRTPGKGNRAVMINPAREKGIDVVLDVAELCPEIPFLIVESWGMSDQIRQRIERINAGGAQVTLHPSTDDMRSIYAEARILLAPSQWEEAWGRVASEAHVSGIPVLGSDRGGLPEAIGPGGLIVPHDAPAERWAEALSSLWHDEAAWTARSEAAIDHASRNEMQMDGHIDRLLNVINCAVKKLSANTERVS